jgi:hypothetical protein
VTPKSARCDSNAAENVSRNLEPQSTTPQSNVFLRDEDMPAYSVSDWDNEYARLARQASQLRSVGGASSSAVSSSLEADRRALIRNVQRLQQSLYTDLKPFLTPSDLQRRSRLVNHLQQQQSQPSSSSLNSNNQYSQTNTAATTAAGAALQQQDEMLDDLANGVERLKHQSLLIGDEAKLHLNLLGDMENHVDIAQSGLEGETRRADHLRQNNTSIWKLQMIVVALAIVLVLLILTGLT